MDKKATTSVPKPTFFSQTNSKAHSGGSLPTSRATNLLSLFREQAWAERGCSAQPQRHAGGSEPISHRPQSRECAETRQKVTGEAPVPPARGLRSHLFGRAHTLCHGGVEDTHLSLLRGEGCAPLILDEKEGTAWGSWDEPIGPRRHWSSFLKDKFDPRQWSFLEGTVI